MRVIPFLLILLASAPVNGAAQALGPQLAGQPVAPGVAADLAQRPVDWQPVPAAGPAPSALPEAGAGEVEARAGTVRKESVTSPVIHRGRSLPGAVHVHENRIYDPQSGLYYWTSGAGTGEVVFP